MDTNNHNAMPQRPTESPQPSPELQKPPRGFPSRGIMVAHIINIILIFAIFIGTHYFLSSNQCTPEVSFRWSVLAAAIYGLLSALLLSTWLHRKKK
jgi:hypothetical protein